MKHSWKDIGNGTWWYREYNAKALYLAEHGFIYDPHKILWSKSPVAISWIEFNSSSPEGLERLVRDKFLATS